MAGAASSENAGAPPPPPLLGARSREESDELLLERCRQGSETAFAVLVRRHQRALIRHCSRIVGEASASDAAQDTFIAAWGEIRSGTEIRALRPWLLTVAHRKALAQLRERRRAPVEALPETLAGGCSPAEQAARAATVRDTLTALAALPEAQRDAFVAVAVQGRSGRQVARQLGISELTARQLVFRARAALRSAAAACLVPPTLLLQWLRRLRGAPTRVAAAARDSALGGWEPAAETSRLLKYGALAIAGAGAVGAGALQLAPSPQHAGVKRESRPAANGSPALALSRLAPGAAFGGSSRVHPGLGPATPSAAGRGVVLFAPVAARAQPRPGKAAGLRPAGAPTGTRNRAVGGGSAPTARFAAAPSGLSGVTSGGLLRGAGAGAAAVSGIKGTVGAIGHAGASVLTTTLGAGGQAVSSVVKRTLSAADGVVSAADGVVSAVTGTAAGAATGTLSSVVAPLVGALEPPAGAAPWVGATSSAGPLSGGVVSTAVSDGSQAVGSSTSGGVATVTQGVAGVAQAAGTAANKVAQGATGAVSALGHLP